MPNNHRKNIRREIIKQMILAECACQDSEEMWMRDQIGKTFDHNGPQAESDMIRSNLATMAKKSYEIHDAVGHNDDLPEWVQEKIAVADSMIGSVYDYLMYEYGKHNDAAEPHLMTDDEMYDEYPIAHDDEDYDHFDMIQEASDDDMDEPEEEDAIRVEPWKPLRQSTGIMFFEDED